MCGVHGVPCRTFAIRFKTLEDATEFKRIFEEVHAVVVPVPEVLVCDCLLVRAWTFPLALLT